MTTCDHEFERTDDYYTCKRCGFTRGIKEIREELAKLAYLEKRRDALP